MKASLLLAALTLAQPQAAVKFHDGSTVYVTVKTPTLDVETKYGRLSVPFADVQHVQFGAHFKPGDDERLQELLNKLGDENVKVREAATKGIQQLGPAAYPFLRSDAKDVEVRQRSALLSVWFHQRFPKDRLLPSRDDTVSTPDGRLSGRITTPAILVESPHLGEMKLNLFDLSSLRSVSKPAELNVQADRDWQDSGMMVRHGSKLHLSAEGQVDLWAQAPGQYLVGPNGYTQAGTGSSFMAGALIGKINDGSPFLVGSEYASFPGDGRLWLRVVPSPWGNSVMSGGFAVKVRIE